MLGICVLSNECGRQTGRKSSCISSYSDDRRLINSTAGRLDRITQRYFPEKAEDDPISLRRRYSRIPIRSNLVDGRPSAAKRTTGGRRMVGCY